MEGKSRRKEGRKERKYKVHMKSLDTSTIAEPTLHASSEKSNMVFVAKSFGVI